MTELNGQLLQKIRDTKPLIHCITNIVVANFQANGLLAIGATPIMADAVEEVAEMASISATSVLNIGTLNDSTVEAMILAGKSAVEHGKPVVLDPVGAGASAFRKDSTLRILNEVNVTLIRGNAGELAAIAEVAWEAKGVDAGEGDMDIEALAKIVAIHYSCIVAITGPEDIVTDGQKVIRISGGHPIMTKITGTGCLLSAVAGAFLAVGNENQLEAVSTALTYYKKAGEKAEKLSYGPGDFASLFINTLDSLHEQDLINDEDEDDTDQSEQM